LCQRLRFGLRALPGLSLPDRRFVVARQELEDLPCRQRHDLRRGQRRLEIAGRLVRIAPP
jgi:hypothetical protein